MTQVRFFSAGVAHRDVVHDSKLDAFVTHLRKYGATCISLQEYCPLRQQAHGILWLAA